MGDIAIPYVFAALMALEFAYNAIRRNGYQDPRDSAVSVMVAFPHFALLTIAPVVWFIAYAWLEPRIPGTLPADAWWIWPLGIVVMDFAAYWMHRYHHALNITWAVHSVHHSSEHLTITTGARSSMAEPFVNIVSGAYLILIAPALLGLPVAAAGVGWLVKDTWGFAVHTRNVNKLGVLEYVLATPSHHRVHHAMNAVYAGKNYGFVFIVWDKLFGTFQPELTDVVARYGTERAPASYHPITVALHGLREVWRDAVAAPRWRDRLRIWFMPAGWRPVVRSDAPGAYPNEPRHLIAIGSLQLVLLLACIVHLAITVHDHGTGANLAYLAFLVLGTAVTGELFDQSGRYRRSEALRVLVVSLMLLTTGTWFGRSDPFVAPLLALAALVAGASLVHGTDTRTDRRASRRDGSGVRGVVVRVLPSGTAADHGGAGGEPAGASHRGRGWQGEATGQVVRREAVADVRGDA